MSDFFNRNAHQVQITKLNSTTPNPNSPTNAFAPNASALPPAPVNVNTEKYDIAQGSYPNSEANAPTLTPIPTVDVTDSDESGEDDTGSDYSYGDSDSDNSDTESDDSGSDKSEVAYNDMPSEQLGGGKRDIDNESTSSVSTTEILSRDPLFLVLSEFLMDEATGNNIVHVGNGLVQVLNKINSKLGRIADALETKNKKKEKKDKRRET